MTTDEFDAIFKLPFNEASRFFRKKLNIPTSAWDDLWKEQHARGFMAAGAMKADLLTDLRGAVQKAIDGKLSLKDFREQFDGIVEKRGWAYKGGRNWRSRLIWDANITTAYQAGRWQQFEESLSEFLRYVHADGVINPRPLHVSWNGTVLPIDHPWWDTHYGPNGWGCHCRAVRAWKQDYERALKEGRGQAPSSAIDPTTGAPVGIDKGWDYNVGKAAFGQSIQKKLMEDQGPWKDLYPAGPEEYRRPAKMPVDAPKAERGTLEHTETGLREALRRAVGGDSVSIADPTGERTLITQGIVDHVLAKADKRWDGREEYFPFIRELLEEPYEIWVNFAISEVSGRVGLRKKYVKVIRLGKNRLLGLYAEIQDGVWVSGDFFRGGMTAANNLRKGKLLYGRE
jgi:hypothetical protein